MSLEQILQALQRVSGLRFASRSESELRLVREADGVEVVLRMHVGAELSQLRDASARVVSVRWTEGTGASFERVNQFNARAALAVCTLHRFGNLYGPSESAYHRAQVLADGLELSRFVAALAHDLGLDAGPAPAPPGIDEVFERLAQAPARSQEQKLLDALFGGPTEVDAPYRRIDEHITGPSSVGGLTRDPVPLEIRVGRMGLVHLRHERPAPEGADLPTLVDACNHESSSQEDCVSYVRVFVLDEAPSARIALEVAVPATELGSELFGSRMAALERIVESHFPESE
jgi:hypothetical protein